MLQAIDTTIYRAGTSRGLLFLASDLPSATEARDAALLSIMGSGHPLQIDGMGGGNSLTSKVAIVSPSTQSHKFDVDYLFCQVGVAERFVDTAPNCGNMMTGVAAFAIKQGLVKPHTSDTTCLVRIFNLNSKQASELVIPVQQGQVHYDKVDEAGIERPSARVGLRFLDTIGACTGKLLPTGHATDWIEGIEVSIIDSAVPVVFIRQEDVGITGRESPSMLNADIALLSRLERVRLEAGRIMGLGDISCSVVPKLSLIGPGTDITTFTARYFTPKACHNAHAVTGAICTAGAAYIPGTVVSSIFSSRTPSLSSSPSDTPRSVTPQRRISIEHPSGILEVGLEASTHANTPLLDVAYVERTVSLIAHARVYYVNPNQRPSQETPITSPATPVDSENLFDNAYRPVVQALDRQQGETNFEPLALDEKCVDPCYAALNNVC